MTMASAIRQKLRRKVMRLYEDDFVTLTDYTLTIKNFHFPSKKEKKIQLDTITVLYFEDQDAAKFQSTKVWGKAQAPIWEFHLLPLVHSTRSNIVIDIGADLKFGFTVERCEEFMDAMRSLLDYHVIVVNTINL